MALEMLASESARLRTIASSPYGAFEQALRLTVSKYGPAGKAAIEQALPIKALYLMNPQASAPGRDRHSLSVRIHRAPIDDPSDDGAGAGVDYIMPARFRVEPLPNAHGRADQFFMPLEQQMHIDIPRPNRMIIAYELLLDGKEVLHAGREDLSKFMGGTVSEFAQRATFGLRLPMVDNVGPGKGFAQLKYAVSSNLPMVYLEMHGNLNPGTMSAQIDEIVLTIEVVSGSVPHCPFSSCKTRAPVGFVVRRSASAAAVMPMAPTSSTVPGRKGRSRQRQNTPAPAPLKIPSAITSLQRPLIEAAEDEPDELVRLGSASQSIFAAAYLGFLERRFPQRSLAQLLNGRGVIAELLSAARQFDILDGLQILMEDAGQPQLPTLNELLHHTAGLPSTFQMDMNDINDLLAAQQNPLFELNSPEAAFGALLAMRCKLVFPLGAARLESPLGYAILGATLTGQMSVHDLVGRFLADELEVNDRGEHHHQCGAGLYAPYGGIRVSVGALTKFLVSTRTMSRLFAHRVPVLAEQADRLPRAAFGMGNVYGCMLGPSGFESSEAESEFTESAKQPAVVLVGQGPHIQSVVAVSFPQLQQAVAWAARSTGPIGAAGIMQQTQAMADQIFAALRQINAELPQLEMDAFRIDQPTPMHRELVAMTRQDLQRAVFGVASNINYDYTLLKTVELVPLLESPLSTFYSAVMRFETVGERPVIRVGDRRLLLVMRDAAAPQILAVDPANLIACIPVRPITYRSAGALNLAEEGELTVEFEGRVYGSLRLARTVWNMARRVQCADSSTASTAEPGIVEQQEERRARHAQKYGGGTKAIEDRPIDAIMASIAGLYGQTVPEDVSINGDQYPNDWPDFLACAGVDAFARAYFLQ